MKHRDAVKLSQPVIVMLYCGFLCCALALAQTQQADPPPPAGMGTGPPRMGDWYRPPVFENRSPPARPSVLEFAPNDKEKRLLAVADGDLQEHAAFLRGRDTGAFRLLTYFPYARRVVSADSPAIAWRPGFSNYASEYSFEKKKHGHGVNGWGTARFGWADLLYRNGSLFTGFMEQSLSLMVQLGDVPLEEVTTSTPGVVELLQLLPPGHYEEGREWTRKLNRGLRGNGFAFASGWLARVNTTYVLRSLLNKRVDHLVAFRVVRQDEGGVTIVWKRLEKYAKPKWKIKPRK